MYFSTSSDYIVHFVDAYMHNHSVPRGIRVNQARSLICTTIRHSSDKHKNNILDAPANDYRAVGVVERMIQTIKRRLACQKCQNVFNDTNTTLTIGVRDITYQLRICIQKKRLIYVHLYHAMVDLEIRY